MEKPLDWNAPLTAADEARERAEQLKLENDLAPIRKIIDAQADQQESEPDDWPNPPPLKGTPLDPCKELRAEVKRLQRENDELTAAGKVLVETNTRRFNSLTEVTTDLHAATELAEQLQSQLSDMASQRAELQRETERLRARNRELEDTDYREIFSAGVEHNDALARIAQLETEKAELEKRIEAIVALSKNCIAVGEDQSHSTCPTWIIEYADGGRGPYRPEETDNNPSTL